MEETKWRALTGSPMWQQIIPGKTWVWDCISERWCRVVEVDQSAAEIRYDLDGRVSSMAVRPSETFFANPPHPTQPPHWKPPLHFHTYNYVDLVECLQKAIDKQTGGAV